jgi:TPR repeat protein
MGHPGRTAVLASGVLLAMACSANLLFAQDENPTTPGAIPNPGTYQGSTELQRQSDQQDQQFRQQQQQQQQQPQSNYRPGYYPAPANSTASAGANRNAPPRDNPRGAFQPFGVEDPRDIAANNLALKGNYAGALRAWMPLAQKGDVNAEYFVGLMYDQGHGAAMNKTEAALWYRKAADKGMAEAMINLAVIIISQAHSSEDVVPAYTWLMIAAARDSRVEDMAQRDMGMLMPHMTYQEITRAQVAASVWVPR